MNFNNIFSIVGKIMLLLALVQTVPAALAFYYNEPLVPFLLSIFITGMIGIVCHVKFQKTDDNEWTVRESYSVVAFSWFFSALVCSVPFLLSGMSPLNAFFESMAGVTTTGSTVMADIDFFPKSLLFWRGLLQWLGGLGVVALFIAVIPKVNMKGRQLYKAEFSGPTEDKLSPKISKTAKILWFFYIGATALLVLLLFLLGASVYDSFSFAFSVMSSGGFAPYNESVLPILGNPLTLLVILFFMMVAGTNFALIYKSVTKGVRYILKDEEFRAYVTFFILVSSALALILLHDMDYDILTSVKYAFFQTGSLMTTTGLMIVDYNSWSDAAKILLFLVMLTGSCSGSTSGGPTFVRWIILFRHVRRDIFKFIHPNAVKPVKYNGRSLPEETVHSTISFMILYFVILMVSSAILGILGLDLITAVTSALAALGNIGPSFGLLGPLDNFGVLPAASRLVLIFNMWIGRLELYTVILLFTREFWKR
ncbi:MAG: TrkH family potassium uptake protein [Methanosarcinales archaeon]|jgi:trk system potassium uptake protein TrkH|nr:TrkH family potassium uptake protein [Methanosarcinales archaeon]